MCLPNPADRFLRLFSLLGALAFFLPASLTAAPEIEIRDMAAASLVSGVGEAPFGSMAILGRKTLTFTVHNTGTSPLTGLQSSLEGADTAGFVLTPAPVATVEPEASTTLSVSFIPTREGSHAARLRVLSNDADESPFLIPLTATGASRYLPIRVEEVGGAELLSQGTAVDFGSPAIGESQARTFKITNLGTAATGVISLEVADPFYQPPYGYISIGYQLVSGFSVTPTSVNLLPGQSTTFEVRWSPSETALKEREVIINGGNVANRPFRLMVKGAGSPYSPAPVALGGLHFRMGDAQGAAVGGFATVVRDVYSINQAPTVGRWLYQPPTVQSAPLASTQAITQDQSIVGPGSLLIAVISYYSDDSFVTGNAALPPLFYDAGAPGGAPDTIGGRVAVHFQGGSYLKRDNRKLPGADDLGMELWVRPESATGRQCITQIGDVPAEGGFGLYLIDGVLHGRVGLQEFAAAAPLTLNVWQHIALVLENGTATLYVNGTASGSLAEAALPALVKGLGLGATVTGGDAFTGAVDEMRMFETAPGGFVPEAHLLLTAKPHAGLDKTALEFGSLITGRSGSQTVSLTNRGAGWLSIRQVEFLGEGAADYKLGSVIDTDLNANRRLTLSSTLIDLPRSVRPAYRMSCNIECRPSVTGPRPAILRFTTNDPDHPTFDVALNAHGEASRPEIAVSYPHFPWGPILTNQSSTFAVTITNEGSEPLTGITFTVTGPNAEDIETEYIGIMPETLAAGGSQNQYFRIHPKGTGARLAFFRITSNDADENPVEIEVYGHGEAPAPDIVVNAGNRIDSGTWEMTDDGALDFGSIMRGGEVQGLVAIGNSGTAELNSLDVTISGPHAADFILVKELDSVPAPLYGTLAPYLRNLVTFKPTGNGARTAVLHVTSNDPDESPFDIHLSGVGVAAAPLMLVENRGVRLKSNGGFVRCGTGVIGGAAATSVLKIRNTGFLPLTNFQTAFSGADGAAFSAAVTPGTIAPGGVGDLVVAFNPAKIGPHGAVLSLTSNDIANPFTVAVGGTGAYGPQATLSAPPMAGWIGTALAQAPNGNVFMAGYVETDGVKQVRLREIRPDGTETGHFDHYSITQPIRAIAVDATGRVLITGSFSALSFPTGPTTGYGIFGQVFRFNADGTHDATFTPPVGPQGLEFIGHAIVALPDGKVLVGGQGVLGGRNHLIRLNGDGTVDDTFTLPAPDAPVNALALQDDGKVLVGGDFTNLGQKYRGPSAYPELTLSLGSPAENFAGLFRLTTNGAVDPDFGNPGYHRVTALAVRGDRIAVGGMEKRWVYGFILLPYDGHMRTMLYDSTSLPNNLIRGIDPTPMLQEWNTARLLNLSGGTLVDRRMDDFVTAVAVQSGDRLLVAPSDGGNGTLPTVALVQPTDKLPEYYGRKAVASNGYPLPEPGISGAVDVRHQTFEGKVTALLPQADGKVLVAGEFNTVRLLPIQSWEFIDYGGAFKGVPLDPNPLPPPALVAGFVQLDIDGFYHPNLHVRDRSDGLARQVFSIGNPFTGINLIGLENEATVVGPNSEDFKVQKYTVASNLNPGVVVEFFDVQFNATGGGPRRAVLKITKAGSDNPFEMALEGNAESDLPEGLVVLESNGAGVLYPGDRSDFGALAVGKSQPRPYLLKNTGALPITAPVQISIAGEHASEFVLTQTGTTTLAAGASTAFKITFRPQAKGVRTAILRVTSGTGLPYEARLEGAGVVEPTSQTIPADRIVNAGEAVMFQVAYDVLVDVGTTCQWFLNQKLVTGATGGVLSWSAVTLADGGRYATELKNLAGKARFEASLVVVDGTPRQIPFGLDKTLTLTAEVAGQGTVPFISYQWLKAGQVLPNDKRITGQYTQKLTIRNATAADAGAYACRVTTPFGARSSGAIEARYLPLPTLASVASYTWTVGRQVTDRLTAEGEGGTWSISGGPPGVIVNAQTGQLSGKPTRAGAFPLKATLSHPSGRAVMNVPVQVQALSSALTGGFLALIDRRPGLFEGCGGLLSLAVTSQGSFSGSLTLNNSPTQRITYPVAGALVVTGDESATAEVVVRRGAALPPVHLALDFLLSDVLVQQGNQDIGAGGQKIRTATASARNVAFVPVASHPLVHPTGFARVTTTASGVTTVMGKLATRWGAVMVTQSTHAVTTFEATGDVPLYLALPKGETASGWLLRDDQDPTTSQGTLQWNAAANAGQDLSLTIQGGLWQPPLAGKSLLGADGQPNQLMLSFNSGESQELQMTATHRLLPASGAGAWPLPQQGGLLKSMTMDPRTGTFSGWTWGLWAGARPLHWSGSVLPFGRVEGLFIPGLAQAVGIYSNVEQPAANQAVLALPVTLELKE